MAGENQFIAFANGSGANVETPTTWASDSVIAQGFVEGVAPSIKCNTAWRQSSVIASMIGAFIASQNFNALDNGSPSGLLTAFVNALATYTQNRIGFGFSGNSWYLNLPTADGTFQVRAGVATLGAGTNLIQQPLVSPFSTGFFCGFACDTFTQVLSYSVDAGSDLEHIAIYAANYFLSQTDGSLVNRAGTSIGATCNYIAFGH